MIGYFARKNYPLLTSPPVGDEKGGGLFFKRKYK
jgi:hypothetical protein